MTAPHLELSIALSDNERTRPLLEGRVAPQGIKLVPTMVHPSEMFWRQLRFAEFDVSEMSMSSLIIAVSRGDTRWVAIPVFTMRKFFYTSIIVRTIRGSRRRPTCAASASACRNISRPGRSGRAASCSTNSACMPATSNGSWSATRTRAMAAPPALPPPPGVRVNQIPPTTNMGEMLIRGELDGSLHYLVDNNLVDRSTVDVSGVTRYLFPDPAAEGRRFYAKTGLFPINHTVVVRRSLLESRPWIALNLYSAFVAAKEEIARAGKSYLQWYFESGLLDGGVKRTLAEHDPLAYGFKAARPVLETVAQYVHEQGLSARRVELKEIFAPSTLDV